MNSCRTALVLSNARYSSTDIDNARAASIAAHANPPPPDFKPRRRHSAALLDTPVARWHPFSMRLAFLASAILGLALLPAPPARAADPAFDRLAENLAADWMRTDPQAATRQQYLYLTFKPSNDI